MVLNSKLRNYLWSWLLLNFYRFFLKKLSFISNCAVNISKLIPFYLWSHLSENGVSLSYNNDLLQYDRVYPKSTNMKYNEVYYICNTISTSSSKSNIDARIAANKPVTILATYGVFNFGKTFAKNLNINPSSAIE